MQQFEFFLVFCGKNKRITILAKDSLEARRKVENDYPDWQVSMFWLVWPIIINKP